MAMTARFIQLRRAPRRVLIILAAAAMLLVAGLPLAQPTLAASSTTYYVAPNGSDANPGTQQQPFGTLNNALKRLNAGDTLLLRGGVYVERVNASNIQAGTSDAPVTVRNMPGERPVVQGLFWLRGADYWNVSGVNVTWGAGNIASEHMVKFSGGTGWSYTNSEVWGAHSYAGILVSGGAQSWTLSGLYVHDTYASNDTNQDHLIYVSEGFNGVIEHSLLINSPNGRGVKLARPVAGDGAPAGVTVRYNTFVNNVGASASSSYDAHDNQIYGNIMVNSGNGKRQNVTALSLSGANVVVNDNIGWQSAGLIEQGAGLVDGGGNRVLDPQLDGNYTPTNPALLDADGAPLYGHLATGGAPTPPATPAPLPTPQPQPSPTPITGSSVVIDDSFTASAVGRMPVGWFDSRGGVGGTLAVALAPILAQKALKAADTHLTGDVRPTKQFAPVTAGVITAQADIMIDNKPVNSAIYVASLMSGSEFASSIALARNGHFMYFDGATAIDTGVAYQAGVWYRVTATLNVAQHTYDIKVQRVGSSQPLVAASGRAWRSAAATSVDRIRFDTSDGELGLNLYIDNVIVIKK